MESPRLPPRRSGTSAHLDSVTSRREVTAVILAGGRSRRLGGMDKCNLTVDGLTLIARRVSALLPLVSEVLIVGGDPARGEPEAPPLGAGVRAVPDDPAGSGPLAGLHAGLRLSRTPWIFATACDMPFLEPRLYFRLFSEREDQDAVVPAVKGWYEPLFAFYHTRCLTAVAAAIAQGRAQIASFYPAVRARFVSSELLREQDPELDSFFNINTERDLEHARARMAPDVTRRP